MKRLLILTVLLAAVHPLATGETVDRIVAAVNGHIILQSDWDDELLYESFVGARPLEQLTVADRKAALDRLIDQELLREQMHISDAMRPSADRVEARLKEVRKLHPEASTEQTWLAALAQYQLSEAQLRQHIEQELSLLRLVEARLRPSVQIDPKSIESYYREELLPQLRQSGAREVPLADATAKIRELLTQQKVNQLLTAWLQNLRAGSNIRSQFLPDSAGSSAQ